MKEKRYRLSIQNNTLYVTKGFEKQAGIYGTDEYNIFRDIKKDNPELNVEYMKEYKNERSTKNIHRLKVSVMEEEIKTSQNEKSIEELTAIKKVYAETKSYAGKIKKLYFDTYPDKASFATLKRKAKEKQEQAKKLDFINKTNVSADNNDTPDE